MGLGQKAMIVALALSYITNLSSITFCTVLADAKTVMLTRCFLALKIAISDVLNQKHIMVKQPN